jgi:hypothetical protein
MQNGLTELGYESNPYIYAAKQVNYANKQSEHVSNSHYTNSKLVHLLCRDAAHSALLMRQARDRLYEVIDNRNYISTIGTYAINDVNPRDLTRIAGLSSLVGARNSSAVSLVMDASQNLQTHIGTTKTTLQSAYDESTTIFTNYKITQEINTVLAKTIKFLSDTLYVIVKSRIAIISYRDSSGILQIRGTSPTLVSQYRESSYADSSGIIHTVGTPTATLSQYSDSSNTLHLPIDNAMYVAKLSLMYLNQLNSEISQSLATTDASSTIHNLGLSNYTVTKQALAREQEVKYYLSTAVLRLSIDNIEKLRIAGAKIYEPAVLPNTPIRICDLLVNSTELADVIATDATLSGGDSRAVELAITDLQTLFYDSSGIVLDSFTRGRLVEARSILTDVLNEVDKVLTNSSAATAIKLTYKVYNTVFGILKKVEEAQLESMRVADDIWKILSILERALTKANSLTINSDIADINKVLWDANAAKGESEKLEYSEKRLFEELTRNANMLVTPERIMSQTQSANIFGTQNLVDAARIARISASAPLRAPEAYSGFKAEIRASQTPVIRPSLENLISRHSIKQLRQDSLRTVAETQVKIAEEVQFTRDISRASFRN